MLSVFQSRLRRPFNKWLFRLRDAEPGEVFLNQRRVFIVPTRPGLAFGLMLVLLFIGAVNYNLSLGFVLTFLIASCAVVDMHLTFRNLAHLHLAAGRVQPVFAGEDACFELHLINRRKHDRYAIWLDFVQTMPPASPQATDVAALATRTVTLSTPTRERGWMPAPRIRLQTRFPLGLLRAWSYWQPDAKALVYPPPEDNAPPLPMAGEARVDGLGNAGDDDFAGIRAYQPGDSIKRLAWRQIARMSDTYDGALVSKHFEGGAAGLLHLDYARLSRALDTERKLSRMTRWLIEAEARGLPYAFSLGEFTLGQACGPAHQAACLRALALYEGV